MSPTSLTIDMNWNIKRSWPLRTKTNDICHMTPMCNRHWRNSRCSIRRLLWDPQKLHALNITNPGRLDSFWWRNEDRVQLAVAVAALVSVPALTDIDTLIGVFCAKLAFGRCSCSQALPCHVFFPLLSDLINLRNILNQTSRAS
jgi:hypothetical protein